VEEIDYEDWYPEVPTVMDTKDLAELLHTNEQIIRAENVACPTLRRLLTTDYGRTACGRYDRMPSSSQLWPTLPHLPSSL
jgi:hypothetical protein